MTEDWRPSGPDAPSSLFGPHHIGGMGYTEEPPTDLTPDGRLLARLGPWAGVLRSSEDGRLHHFPVQLVAGTRTAWPHTDCTDAFLSHTALCGWLGSDQLVGRPQGSESENSADHCAHCKVAMDVLSAHGRSLADVDPGDLPFPADPGAVAALERQLAEERVDRAAREEAEERRAAARAEVLRWVPTRRAVPFDRQTHWIVGPVSTALCGIDAAGALPAPTREPSRRWAPVRLIYTYDPASYPDCEICGEARSWLSPDGEGLVGITARDLPLTRHFSRSPGMSPGTSERSDSRPMSEMDADTDDEDEESLDRIDWTFASDADLVYGASGLSEGDVILERSVLEDVVAIRRAVVSSDTWGELAEKLPERLLSEVLERIDAYELESRGLTRDAAITDLPADLPLVIPGWEELQWPKLPEYAMHRWLPSDVRDEFGSEEETLLDGEFSVIKDISRLVVQLTHAGARCTRDDSLVAQAYVR